VPPPHDRIWFPGSIKADLDGKWLYVANSNADLKYNHGTLVAVDLEAALSERANPDWQVCPAPDYLPPANFPKQFCCWDYLDHNVLDCDERQYVSEPSTVEIGSFAAGMALQKLADSKADCAAPKVNMPPDRHDCNRGCAVDEIAARLYIGVRGNSSITYLDTSRDADGRPVLTCHPPPGANPGNTATDACAIKEMLPANASQHTFLPDEP